MRAMIVGKRHRRRPSAGRPAFVLMSVLALLALACFPVFAHAEDSSGAQYTDAIPSAEGENSSAHHNKRPPIAKASEKGGATTQNGSTGKNGSQQAPSESMEGASEKESSSEGGGGAAAGNGSGTGQGNPGGSATGKANAPAQQSGQPNGTAASQESDSGSSPLIPILAAILILAAISVGAVMYRQRRQRRGPTTSSPSPKAS
ncbi:MAG TPA: hypothetical protein VHR65_04515 [Solirubrobacterales bacterium]|nr:hypothetical protein [Solirubrobacterales bacterium]